jgi:hypothetical protein
MYVHWNDFTFIIRFVSYAIIGTDIRNITVMSFFSYQVYLVSILLCWSPFPLCISIALLKNYSHVYNKLLQYGSAERTHTSVQYCSTIIVDGVSGGHGYIALWQTPKIKPRPNKPTPIRIP